MVSNIAKSNASITNLPLGSQGLTWDDASFVWNDAAGTWDKPAEAENVQKNTSTIADLAKS